MRLRLTKRRAGLVLRIHVLALVLLVSPRWVTAQEFRNLGFDEAITNTVKQNTAGDVWGPVSDLFLGWNIGHSGTPSTNTDPIINGYLNGYSRDFLDEPLAIYSIDNPLISPLFSAGTGPVWGSSLAPYFSGPYVGVFLPAVSLGPDIHQNFFQIAQTGDVPNGVGEIQFIFMGGGFNLAVGGENVSLTTQPLATFNGNTLWRATGDIARFAGRNVELKFTTSTVPISQSFYVLDSIQFVPVPEPSTLGLVTLGSGVGWVAMSLRR